MSHKSATKDVRIAKHYWCPHPDQVWVLGELQSEDKTKKTLSLFVKEDNTTSNYPIDSCILVENNSILSEDVEDLTSLSQVNDATILNCSRIRFEKSLIYTSIGAVLMAINPFEKIDGLYGSANIARYHWNSDDAAVSPHIYLTPAGAYKAMALFGKNQSLIISGESGAGKTEATKQCLDYLTKVSAGHSSLHGESGGDENISEIAHRIISASPILEAFGNAQTVRNPNSSRFGKWMELTFNKHNEIKGSRIVSYLLEKSRVTQHDQKERNYHLFYQIIRGANDELLNSLLLKNSSTHYRYLCKGQEMEANDFKDADNFHEMMEAFHVMGFSSESSIATLKLVAAVLLLGNVEFEALDDDEASRVDEVNPESRENFHSAAHLLGLEANTLGMAMCTRTIQSGGLRKSITTVRLNRQRSSDTRDTLARCIYDKLFLDVIKKINASSHAEEVSDGSDKLIGLLDIFGFEIFESNSFEQLCINYCNEMLQNHFTYVIFVSEIKMYEDENIICDSIEFKDNANIIQLIENSFKSLDEESRIPRGSSKTWYDKIKNSHNSNSLDKKKASTTGQSESTIEILMKFPPGHDAFTISHYAGPVSYIPENFMEKNTEILSNDLVNAMLLSEINLVKEMFTPDPQPPVTTASPGRRSSGGKAATSSLSKNFQTQLQSLMSMLGQTESHFVKCIKSNSKCRAKDFEASLIHRQLLYSGVFEVVKIQQSGLPSRLPHADFNSRYRCILSSKQRWNDIKKREVSIANVLQSVYPDKLNMVQVGRTLTFMKGKELRFLENRKRDIEENASAKLKQWILGRKLCTLYFKVKEILTDFDKYVAALDLNAAEVSIVALKTVITQFSILTHNDSLAHIIDRNNDLVVSLKLQLEIVSTIDSVIVPGGDAILSDETYNTLEAAICEASSIHFEHESVSRALEATKKYTAAKESILRIAALKDRLTSSLNNKSSIVKNGINDNESQEFVREVDEEHLDNEDSFENDELTSTELSDILSSLESYGDSMPGAVEALDIANRKLNEIKVEMDSYFPQLLGGLRSEELLIDEVTGDVVSVDKNITIDSSPLSFVLSTINPKKLRGKECKVLHAGCDEFLRTKSAALKGDAQSTLDLIDNFRQDIQGTMVKSGDSAPEYFHDLDRQFVMLQEWATEKLLFVSVLSALTKDCVVLPHELQQHIIVDVKCLEGIDQVMGKGQTISNQILVWIDLCKNVLNMRNLYNAKEWSDLKEGVIKYNILLCHVESFSAGVRSRVAVLNELKEEMKNFEDIANFYILYEELKNSCLNSTFSLIDVDNLHISTKEVLQISIHSQSEVLHRAKMLVKPFNKGFHDLMEFLELSTKLSNLMMDGNRNEAKELANSLKNHVVLDLAPKLNAELGYCLEIINILEKERELEKCMKKTQIAWIVCSHPTEALSSIRLSCAHDGAVEITRLNSACEEVIELTRCPKKLMQRAKDALKYLVEARKLSCEIEREESLNGGPIMKPCLVGSSTPGRSSRHELATANNVKECMIIFEISLTTARILPENVVEIKCLLLELQRRILAYQFHDVNITKRSITGRVGQVCIDKDLAAESVVLFSDINELLNSFRGAVVSNEAAVISEFESQKLHPSDKARTFPTLFFNHLDPIISLSERIIPIRGAAAGGDWKEIESILVDTEEYASTLSSQKASGNRDYYNMLFVRMLASNEEFNLVKLENDHNKLIATLRDAVDNLQIEYLDRNSKVQKFNPDPKTIRVSLLESAKLLAESIGCHSDESVDLMKIAHSLLNMLSLLKTGHRDQISYEDMAKNLTIITSKMHLSGFALSAILHYVKFSQVIQKFFDTAKNTANSDTKSLYLVTLKYSNRLFKSCSEDSDDYELGCDLKPWVLLVEELRQLRLLQNTEDWPGVVELVESAKVCRASSTTQDEVQVSFIEFMHVQREAAYRKAKANEVAAQFSIASSAGMVGSNGIASLHTPELGIGMLRLMLEKSSADSIQYDILPETRKQKEKMSSLLHLRESVFCESNTVADEKAKFSSLNKHSPKVMSARDKTATAVSKSCEYFNDECKFISETSTLLQLIENLEREVLKPVVTWASPSLNAPSTYQNNKDSKMVNISSFDQTTSFSDCGQVLVHTENLTLQKNAIAKIRSLFPDKHLDISLINITNSLHEILSATEYISDYSALEDKLRSFNILVKVSDMSDLVKDCLRNQVSVFQKGHLIDQLTTIITEGSDLLSSHNYSKTVFDNYLDKVTHLTIVSGESNMPGDMLSCIQCMRCCRNLIAAADFLLSADFVKHRNELDQAAAQTPEWFYNLLQLWVVKLNNPVSTTAAFLRDAEKYALSRQDSTVAGNPKCHAYDSADRSLSLRLRDIGDYIQQMIKIKSNTGGHGEDVMEKKFFTLYTSFNIWKERYNLLNLTWQGFQCLNEKFAVSEAHGHVFARSLFTPCMAIFHVDTFTLSAVTKLLKDSVEKEPDVSFRKAMTAIEKIFSNIVDISEAYLNTTHLSGKKSSVKDEVNVMYLDSAHQLAEVEQTFSYCCALTQAFTAVNNALIVLESLAGLKFNKKFTEDGIDDSIAYFLLDAEVNAEHSLTFNLFSNSKNWYLDAECSPNFLLELCTSDNKKKKYLQTLFGELVLSFANKNKALASPFEFSHFSTVSKKSYLMKVYNISSTGKVAFNICCLDSNDQIVITFAADVYSKLGLDYSSFVSIMCIGAEELKKTWSSGLDPSLSSTIQDILGCENACTGNRELKQLIANARDTVEGHLKSVIHTSSMLLTSQSGYNLLKYSPWSFQWIDSFMAEKNLQLVSANITDTGVLNAKSSSIITLMIKSHSFLKAKVESLCGSTRIFQENVMDIISMEPRESIRNWKFEDGDAVEEWLDSNSKPNDDFWKLSKKVAKDLIDRYSPSQGVFYEFVTLMETMVASVTPPNNLVFFSALPSDEGQVHDLGICTLIQDFMTRISSRAMHPLVTFIILCTQEMYFVAVILERNRKESTSSDDGFRALDMLCQGSYFVESFASHLNALIVSFKDACFQNEMKTKALDLITRLELCFEDLICRIEGLWRLKLTRDGFFSAAVNRKNMCLSTSFVEKKKKASGSFVKTTAAEVVMKSLSLGFKNKLNNSHESSSTNKTFLKPVLSEYWRRNMELEGSVLDSFFKLRALTFLWSDEKAIVPTQDATIEITTADSINKAENQRMTEEAELLLPLSAAVVQIPDNNIRSHMMKEVGVVSLRNSKLDLDDKISEIILLVKMCGCDVRALQLGLHKRGLFDVSEFDDDNEDMDGTDEEIVLGVGGSSSSNSDNNSSSRTASHYVSFLDSLDSICNVFLSNDENYLDVEGFRVPALSRGELGKQVGMLYMGANNLGALGRPSDNLLPPKLASKSSGSKLTSLPEESSSKSSNHSSHSSAVNSSVPLVSPVHLLATRLMFMGYLKSHLMEIIQKVECGNMHPLGRVSENDSNTCETTSPEGQIHSIPFVPYSFEAFSWLSYDEDSHNFDNNSTMSQRPSLRRSSSATRVKNVASNPNYSINGLKNFYLELKHLFNGFLAVRCEFYQNLGLSNISKCVAFLNDLDDFSAKYYIAEVDEIMKTYESIAKKQADVIAENAVVDVGEIKDFVDCDTDSSVVRVNNLEDTLDSIAERKAAHVPVVLSTRTLLNHLCSNKDFNSKGGGAMADMTIMSFLCLPEWVCARQDILSACRRMKQEVKYALQTSMIDEYHKNLVTTLEKHKKIFDEVVQASFSSKAEPKLLIAEVDGDCNSNLDDRDTTGHNLLHMWFNHRFKESHVENGIPMDAIVFEFLKEDVFESEEAARTFFEALDTDKNGSLSFRSIMDGAFSKTFEERFHMEKFISKLRRRNSLRRSVTRSHVDSDAGIGGDDDYIDRNQGFLSDVDDIQHIHEAFLKFYFDTVMNDNHALDNLVKAVPHLDGDDDKLPPETVELLHRAKLIIKIRNTANAGFFFNKDENYSVEEFLDEWFDSVPDPGCHVGSSEVKAVHIATKNKVVCRLFDTNIKELLQTKAATYVDDSTNDESLSEQVLIMDHSSSIETYSKILSDNSFSTKEIKSTLNSLFMGKEFACSATSLKNMTDAALINDLLITKEKDLWEGLGVMHGNAAHITSDIRPVAQFFEKVLHEFKCRDYFKAATEELHEFGTVDLSMLFPSRCDQVPSNVICSDVELTTGDDVDSTELTISRSGDVSVQSECSDDYFNNDIPESSTFHKVSGEDMNNEDDQVVQFRRIAVRRSFAGTITGGATACSLPSMINIDATGSAGFDEMTLNSSIKHVDSNSYHQTISLPAPPQDHESLITAVYDLIYQSARKNSLTVDKRLVLLFQFLNFQLDRHNKGSGSTVELGAVVPLMTLKDMLLLSAWVQLTSSEWSSLFPISYGAIDTGVISNRSLRQPLSVLKFVVTVERRKYIQLWQREMFDAACSTVRSDSAIISPPATQKDYYDGDIEAKAAAIRMAEFSDFNYVDMGKSTTIRTMELNDVLAVNLRRILAPFAELYGIFATNNFKDLYCDMSAVDVDRINFIFSSNPPDRFIQESLRVFNWVLAGLPQDVDEVDDDSDGVASEEEDVEVDLVGEVDEKRTEGTMTLDADEEEIKESRPDVGETTEATAAPPTPLELLSIAMQCSIPSDIRQHLLFCRVQCVNAVNKKFLIKELRRAADGDLKEHLGRQQVFTDLSKAFTELSFILVEMENKEACALEECFDEMNDNRVVDDGLHSLTSSTNEFEAISDFQPNSGDHTGIGSTSTSNTTARKRTSISTAMTDFKNTTADLVKAGHWILRLEMCILTEDWEGMDAMIQDHEANPIDVKECPDAISSFISLGCDIKSHNECLDKMETYLYYNTAKTTKNSQFSHSTVSGNNNHHNDSRPFFHFVNFLALKPLVSETNAKMLVKSSELAEKIELCQFLIKVKAAIMAEKWFENEAQNEKFIADLNISRPLEASTDVEQPISEVARRIQMINMKAKAEESRLKAIAERRDTVCVSTLLKKEKPGNLPRIVATEIQRIEREFQNQQVEICLVEALSQGQEYLKNNDLSLIQIGDLEEVCDIASGMTQRSQRTSLLFDSAQKVMNLRRCLKAADWVGVRCWLTEPSEVAPEAFNEIDAIEKLSDMNLEMHVMLESAMQNNCVGGSYMKLDTSNTNISMLLVAIRNSSHCPKLSPEDRQICYTAECLKSIRLSILMSDYDTLIAEIMAIDVKDISSCALDEFLLVKKAINFFECMNKLRYCLGCNGPQGKVGNVDAQNISIYRLGSATNSIDYNVCSQSIQLYLQHATVIKNIRSAFKGGRFGISSLVECLVLECVDKSQRANRLSPPQLQHVVRHIRKMTYGREILGGVYINEATVNELTLGRIQGDMERNGSGITTLLEVGMSNTSEQWKKRVYKDGDNITDVKTPYEDVPNRKFYLSTLLTSSLLRRKDPDSVAAQLGQLLPQLLSESEDEILLVRDELYNRIALNVLNRGLLRSESSNKHEERRFKSMDVDMSPIQIEHAIYIVQHLGIKSEAAMKLYHTAVVMKKMRYYSKDARKSQASLTKVVEALGQIKSLKSNNLFAAVATAEIESVFNMVCSKTVRSELTKALDQCLPRLKITSDTLLSAETSSRRPFTDGSNDNYGSIDDNGNEKDLKKIVILRKALRASTMNGEQRDGDIGLLRDMCFALHAVMAAKNSGIHDRMIHSHDLAERLSVTTEASLKAGERKRQLDSMFNSNRMSSDEIDEIDLPSLSKRMSKEISIQRRSMLESRYTSATSSAENPLHLAQMRRNSFSEFAKQSINKSGLSTGRRDFARMNSLELYEATGETNTSTLIEKGMMAATQEISNTGKSKSILIFPPFFHGTNVKHFAADDDMTNMHDEKVVEMITAIVDAHAAALKPTLFYISPQKMKQEKLALNSSVRVSLNGKFKIHLEAISLNVNDCFSAVQKIAATFLFAFLKFPKDVKLTSNKESTVTVPKKLLESSLTLLRRNEQECFLTGASISKLGRADSSRARSTSVEGNIGYQVKRNEIRQKSLKSFEIAIMMGEFIELCIAQITSQCGAHVDDKKLTVKRLDFLESYMSTVLSTFITPTHLNLEDPCNHHIDGGSKEQKDSTDGSLRSVKVARSHPMYNNVLNRIKACKSTLVNVN